MKTKNKYLIIAGVLNFLTFLLHLVGGQIDLVNPLLNSSLSLEETTQWVGVWNMITIILLATSYVLFSAGLGRKFATNVELIKFVFYLNLLFCFPSILASFYYGILVPQWIFFVPITVVTIIGLRKIENHA